MSNIERIVESPVATTVREATKAKITKLGVLDMSKSDTERGVAASTLISERISGAKTVSDLLKIRNSGDPDVAGDVGAKIEDVEAADARAALLEISEAHYELLIDQGYEEQVVAGGRSVDDILPEPLKGLGSWIADCAFIDEDGKLDGPGAKIRKLMERVDRVRHENPDELGDKANEVLRQVSKLDFIESDRVDISKDVAIDYLAKWIQESEGESYDYHKAFIERSFPPEGETLGLVRRALDIIESSTVDSHDLSVQSIESWLLMIAGDQREKDGRRLTSERIRMEIKARLALHNTNLEMHNSNGHLTAKDGSNIQDAVGRLKRSGMLMTREQMMYLMRGAEGDMEIHMGDAWDLFQDAVCDYQKILDATADFDGGDRIDIMSKPVLRSPYFPTRYSNFFIDNRLDVQSRVRNYMVHKISQSGVPMTEARKAVELAEDMMWATGEVSGANLAFAGGDKLSELIHFGELLSDDSPKGKNVGSRILRGHIETLMPGWLRFISRQKDPHTPIYHDASRGGAAIIYENATGKLDWETFYAMIIPQKAQVVKDLLMSTDPVDPKKVGVTMFAEINDAFSKIDPYDELTLRPWVYAVMLMNSTADSRTVWRQADVWRMQRAALSVLSMTEDEIAFMDELDRAAVRAGKAPERKRGIDSFLTKEQMEWAMKQSKAMGNVRIYSLLNDLEKAAYNVKL
ncbi:MAG TPA: hypothetical protein VN174_02780 [Candidatus Methanoperedens sp.]|nr:hypothetical protein [Candidatus Methanoperedens sp.]